MWGKRPDARKSKATSEVPQEEIPFGANAVHDAPSRQIKKRVRNVVRVDGKFLSPGGGQHQRIRLQWTS